jgi:hypothetical protein
MSKRILGLLSCLAFVALAYAGDVWKDKPYKQWEEKDVRKILTDSPWAKTATVEARWRSQGGDSAGRLPQGNAPAAQPSGGGGMSGGPTGSAGSYGAGSASAADISGPQVGQANYMVRWGSAKTVREAIARSYVLQGKMKADDADKALADEPAEYQISIAGQDMTPFLKAEEKDLQAKAYLMLKKEKTKLNPVRVVINRKEGAKPDDPQSVMSVIFLFAKKDASGQPAINAQEKNVEFSCESGGATLRLSFDLQKMAAAQGPDW